MALLAVHLQHGLWSMFQSVGLGRRETASRKWAATIVAVLLAAGFASVPLRAREANVYRLAELSVNIIDQCVAQGVPFAREYGGGLANRSFGGVQVSRTFYARGQST